MCSGIDCISMHTPPIPVLRPVGKTTDRKVPSLLADLNGDGKMDLVTDRVVYLQTSPFGDFSKEVPLPIGVEPLTFASITAADMDGVNGPDLVTAYKSSETTPLKQSGIKIFLNPGSGDFSTVTPTLVGGRDQGTESVTVADVNGDGFIDVVAGNGFFNGKFVRNKIYLNRGDLTFGWMPEHVIEFGPADGVEGEVTLDVKVGSSHTPHPPPHPGNTHTHTRTCARLLAEAPEEAIQTARELLRKPSLLGPQVADVDQDTLVDIIVINSNSPNQVYKTLAFDAAMFTIDIDSPTAIGHTMTGGRGDDTRAVTVREIQLPWH